MSRPLLLALASSLGLATACARQAGAREAPAAPAPAASPLLAEPERARHTPEVLATGLLKSRQSSSLAPAVPGTLLRVAVRRGQAVAEGAVLLELDADQARAARAQAGAGVAASAAQLRLAEDALARAEEIRRLEGGVSPAQLVQAEAQRDLARAQLQAAEAQREQAEVTLRRHALRAPFAGVVTKVPDGVGMPVAPGAALVSLESTRALVLETSLSQEEAAGLRAGDKVEVWVPATGARTGEATVAAVVPSVDPTTARVPVEVAVPNADGRFLPHASARARFPAGPARDVFRVPAASLLQREGAFAVWTAAAGRARALPVRVLAQGADTALVDPGASGWPPGARVVQRPPLGITEGAALQEAVR